MEADRNAPVFAESSVQIDAPPQVEWEVMSAIDEWPSWNPDVKEARLDGTLREDTQFTWKSGPGTIRSTLREVVKPRRLSWTGVSFGIKAIHVWDIQPSGGVTVVRTEESWDGLVVKLTKRASAKALQKALDDGPRYLKAEAERRSTGMQRDRG